MPVACPIFITLGDPLSINIEVILKTVSSKDFDGIGPVIFIGSHWQLIHQAKVLNLPVPSMTMIKDIAEVNEKKLYFLDPLPKKGEVPPENLSVELRGELAVAALKAVPSAMKDEFAVLTSPIDKFAASKAGFSFPGQTEFFENLWQGKAVMLLAGPKLRVGLVTNHVALKDVPKLITSQLIEEKLDTLSAGLKSIYGIDRPKIAVCGLNPHSSDKGLFGNEEQEVILPAIKNFCSKNKDVEVFGPEPADTIFYYAYQGKYDAVLAMYHDQGLGPLKALHFDSAINLSLGLKNLRVSPDHGPAANIYGKGMASLESFKSALKSCQTWVSKK